MKYSLVAVSALATAVAAQPKFLNTAFDVEEGKTFELKFDGCESSCTIILQNGESTNLKEVKTLSSSATDGSISVDLDDLPSDTYNFKITDNTSGEINYSSQFKYEGTGVAVTTTSSASVTETSAVSTISSAASSGASSSAVSTSLTTFASAEPVTIESTAVTPPASATPVASSANGTFTTATKSASAKPSQATGSAAETTPATTVPNSGAARMTSSLALIAGAVAAMMYLN